MKATKGVTRWKHVFVLCTGRCGSTTFARAAEHASNYSVGHETRTHLTGAERFGYPANHIEVDNRLSWLLGRLDRELGADAFYVHLTRDADAVAGSFVKRAERGIFNAYRTAILGRANRLNRTATLVDFALDYTDTVTTNIELFLRDKPHRMDVCLETIQQSFPKFWERIGAVGSLESALAECRVRHNSS